MCSGAWLGPFRGIAFHDMKIKKETLDLIVIEEGRIWQYFLAGIFALAGLIIVFTNVFGEETPRWLGIIFFAVGILSVFLVKRTTATFDKNAKKLFLLVKRLTGKKIQEYDLDQIQEIQLRRYRSVESSALKDSTSFQERYSYMLVFILNDNKEIDFGTREGSPINGRTIGEKMANFLNIPFKEV